MTRGGRIARPIAFERANQFADLTGPQDFAAQGHNPWRVGGMLGNCGQRLLEDVVIAALIPRELKLEDKARERVEVRHYSYSFPAV